MSRKKIALTIACIVVVFGCDNSSLSLDQKYDDLKPLHSIPINLNSNENINQFEPDSSTNWLDIDVSMKYRIDVEKDFMFILNNPPGRRDFSVYNVRKNEKIFSISDKSVGDFAVDKTDQSILILFDNNIIYKYNYDGTLINRIKLDNNIVEFRSLSSGVILGYNNYMTKGTSNFYLFDLATGKTLKEFLKFDKKSQGLGFSVNTSLSRFNNKTIYASKFFSNSIYRYTEGEFEKFIEIDFGTNNPQIQTLINEKDKTNAFKIALKNNWVYTIDKIIDNKNFISCSIIFNGKPIHVLISKNNPNRWSITNVNGFDCANNNLFIRLIKDRETTIIQDGKVNSTRAKLLFYGI